ncbi:MAG: phosphatidate cytidylyltransferase [Candidatus Omnitrophica bacterium]|nr:phosphatidate cytidylyltransferase [Candidatus Omnitrophota bacterium]
MFINIAIDKDTIMLLIGIFSLLSFASLIGFILKRALKTEKQRNIVANLNSRIKAWWVMCVVFVGALLTGGIGSYVLFSLISFMALREYITLTPTKKGDHRALFWAFFVILPLNYYFLATQWYGMYVVFIPVYAFIFLPIRTVIAGDYERFLERTAKIQWGLMVCVYCISAAPALLTLSIPGYEGQNGKLLFFLVFVVQMSDVCQYIFGRLFGRRKISPNISPNKTVEGFVGGIITATLLGTSLWWITPFNIWQAAGFSLLITVIGFFGDLTMSAIKRDRGIKDYGTTIKGHGGILDRIDSLCFSAPVFFHLVRYFF